MSIKRPDIYEHNNPLLPIVDSNFVRGGNIVVQSLYELTQLYQRYEQLKQFATVAYVKDIGKRYLLIGNPNNHASSAFTLDEWLKLDVESTSTGGGGGQLPAPTTQELSVRILYKQLMDLIRNSELIPGLNYTILDYDGLHGDFLSPAGDSNMEITVKAILPNQLSEEALFVHFFGDNKPKQYTGLYKVGGIENVEGLNKDTATLAIEQFEIIPFSENITASIQTPDGIYVFGLYCYKKLTDPHWTENADISYQVNYVSTITIGEETWYCLLGESDSYLKTKDFITFINVDIICDGEMTSSNWSQLQYLDSTYYLFTESLSNTYYKSFDGTNFDSQNFNSNLSIVDSIIFDGKLFVLPKVGYGIYRIFAESALRIGELPENGSWETMSVGDDGIVYISGPNNYSINLSAETPVYVLQSLNDPNCYNRQYIKFQFNGSTNTLQVGESGLNIRTSDDDFFSTTNIGLFKKARIYQETDSGNNYYYLIDRSRAIVFWNVPYYNVNKGLVTKLVDDYNNIANFDFKSSRINENFLFGSTITCSDLSYSGACRNNNVFGTPYEIKEMSLLTENGFSNLTLLNAPDRLVNLTPADGNTQVQYLNYINGVGILWYSYDNNLQMVAKIYDPSNETWSDYNVAVTIPSATSTVSGVSKLASDTIQTVNANAISAIEGKTYGIQKNGDGQLVVNVPWEAGGSSEPPTELMVQGDPNEGEIALVRVSGSSGHPFHSYIGAKDDITIVAGSSNNAQIKQSVSGGYKLIEVKSVPDEYTIKVCETLRDGITGDQPNYQTALRIKNNDNPQQTQIFIGNENAPNVDAIYLSPAGIAHLKQQLGIS